MPTPRLNDNLITKFAAPGTRFKSQYGMVSEEAWCILEMQRAAARGKRYGIVHDKHGRIALAREAPVKQDAQA